MKDTFEKELLGQFRVPPVDMEVPEAVKTEKGELACSAIKTQLKSLGWFNHKWTCLECPQIFHDPIELDKHSLKLHKKRAVLSCEACGTSFGIYSDYLNHVIEDHEPMLKYSCLFCSDYRTSFDQLFKHIQLKHSNKQVFFCLYCGWFSNVGCKLKDHLDCHFVDESKKFECDFCGYIKHNKWTLFSHIMVKHKEKHLKCDLCPKIFSRRFELKIHHKSAHLKLRDIQCTECGQVSAWNE